jgi:hypothetical protein
VDGKPVVADSQLGLEFQGWHEARNGCGNHPDGNGQSRRRLGKPIRSTRHRPRSLERTASTLTEKAAKPRIFGLIVRATTMAWHFAMTCRRRFLVLKFLF